MSRIPRNSIRRAQHGGRDARRGARLPAHARVARFLFGTLDDLDGHYRRYTKRTMRALFDGMPGRVVKLYYFNLIGVPGWFVKGRVLKQRRHTNDNYAIMNALLPVVRPLETLISPPLGMSVIGIFRKD